MTPTTDRAQPEPPADLDPRFLGALDMLGRTGAATVQVRYSDEDQPAVWFVVAGYTSIDGPTVWEVGAGLDPLVAAVRCATEVVDGAICVHCHKPTALDETFSPMEGLDHLICWYAWDPELARFRRSCEGDHP